MKGVLPIIETIVVLILGAGSCGEGQVAKRASPTPGAVTGGQSVISRTPTSVAKLAPTSTPKGQAEKKGTILVQNQGVSADGFKIYTLQTAPRKGNNPFLVAKREGFKLAGPTISPQLTSEDIDVEKLFFADNPSIKISRDKDDFKVGRLFQSDTRQVYIITLNPHLVFKVFLTEPINPMASAEFSSEQGTIKSEFVFLGLPDIDGGIVVDVTAIVDGVAVSEIRRTLIEVRNKRGPEVFVPGQN